MSIGKNGNRRTVRSRAVDGSTEEQKLTRRRHQNGRLIELSNGWSCRFYEDYLEDGLRKRRRIQQFLGSCPPMNKQKAKDAMAAVVAAINNPQQQPLTTSKTFREFALAWVEKCRTRNKKPNKPSVLANKECVLTKHVFPIIGHLPLGEVENEAMRTLVTALVNKKLAPQTIKNILILAKAVKRTATDSGGHKLFAVEWNNDHIDAPDVDPEKQRRPMFTAPEVEAIARTATGRLQMMLILCACSGLRAGELLALETKHFDETSVKVEQAVWSGRVQSPKTPNARRFVELHPDVCTLLTAFLNGRKSGFIFQTNGGRPLAQSNLIKYELHPLLKRLGIAKQGFHSFRRFRVSYLRRESCPEGLLKYWAGHSKVTDVTDRYDRSNLDLEYRRDVATRRGIGFELPKMLTPKLKKSEQATSVLGILGRQPEPVLV